MLNIIRYQKWPEGLWKELQGFNLIEPQYSNKSEMKSLFKNKSNLEEKLDLEFKEGLNLNQ